MLRSLRIENLAVVEAVAVDLGPGLTTVTGETGTGKSVLIDGLLLALGVAADPGMVRAGTRGAYVEALFELDAERLSALQPLLDEAGVEPGEGALVLSRAVPAAGRSVSRVNGRAVPAGVAARVGALLVDVHAQTEAFSLLRPGEHLEYLDRFAGTLGLREELTALERERRQAARELGQLEQDERERLRTVDRLQYEIEEIERAGLQPDEEEMLRAERAVLVSAAELRDLLAAAHRALVLPRKDGPGAAVDALGAAVDAVQAAAQVDARLVEAATTLSALQEQAFELAAVLRTHAEALEADPARLEEVESRLAACAALRRKYGLTLEDVLRYQEEGRARLERLLRVETEREVLAARVEAIVAGVVSRAMELAGRRAEAAARLATAVQAELEQLGLPGGRFAVRLLRRRAEGDGPILHAEETYGGGADGADSALMAVEVDEAGAERAEFVVALNPGQPPQPLHRVASGGETARLLLALKSVLGAHDRTPTLVFDEIEVGVGGRSGRVIGSKLAALARLHQVIAVTHLPQVAAFGDTQYCVEKRTQGGQTLVTVRPLLDEERVEELALMLGGDFAAAREGARELLAQARSGR